MSDFEGNPFADPAEINPFEDAAVKQASSGDTQAAVADDYNPFSEEAQAKAQEEAPKPPPTISKKEATKKKKPTGPKRPASETSPPAIIQHDLDAPPEYSPAYSFDDNNLRQREEEIARREEALQKREQNIQLLGPQARQKNFPPFPKCCPIQPCFYINISEEIPPGQQWKFWLLTALYIYYCILLVINFAFSIAGVVTPVPDNTGSYNYPVTMGVAVAYLLLFIPGALFCWWLPAYQAYKKDSSLAFMWFFFCMSFQCLGFVLNAIGIPNLGACGFVLSIPLFKGSLTVGIMFVVVGILWLLALPVGIFLIVSLHRYYRTSGMTIQQATDEAVSGAAKNKYVRGAAKSAVKTGVKAGMAAATSSDE